MFKVSSEKSSSHVIMNASFCCRCCCCTVLLCCCCAAAAVRVVLPQQLFVIVSLSQTCCGSLNLIPVIYFPLILPRIYFHVPFGRTAVALMASDVVYLLQLRVCGAKAGVSSARRSPARTRYKFIQFTHYRVCGDPVTVEVRNFRFPRSPKKTTSKIQDPHSDESAHTFYFGGDWFWSFGFATER